MRDNTRTKGSFTRRAFILGSVQTALVSTLVGRLYYLQFLKKKEYETLAEDNRINIQLVAPIRGLILDRNGIEIATNRKNFRLLMELDRKQNLSQRLDELDRYFMLSKEDREIIDERISKARKGDTILIKEFLSWKEMARIEYARPDLPGLFIEVGQLRFYPLAEAASHLIGYVGSVSESEMTDQPVVRLPGFKIGKNGFEKMSESLLRGEAGIKHIEVNVTGIPVRELSYDEGKTGDEISLTIDSRLQEFTANRLQGESASAVVMDAHSGDILALASVPSFDPNSFSRGISSEYWKILNDNEKNPLLNKAISGQYPPGSTFKMIVGLAALKAGIIKENTTFFCPGHYQLGKQRFNCWKPTGHGNMNLHDALAQSCDTFFYKIATELPMEKINEMAREFGLGDSIDIALPGEKAGLLPDGAWKRERFGQIWLPGDTVNASIGQGYVLATPIQLAVMTARIANGGKKIMPRLVKDPNFTPADSLSIPKHHMRVIKEGMEAVTGTKEGTAYWQRILNPDYAMAGKTGTSQVKRILTRGQKQEELPWHHRHHALFVGYAPLANPKYVVSVVIEHGGSGSAAAAPVARDILEKIQQLSAEPVASFTKNTI